MSRVGKSQSTLEYVFLFTVIVASFIAMQVYFKRGIQGRMKSYTEQLGIVTGYSPGATDSYEENVKDIQETTNVFGGFREGVQGRIDVSESSAQSHEEGFRDEIILPFADESR